MKRKIRWVQYTGYDGLEHYSGRCDHRSFAGYSADRERGEFLPVHARKPSSSERDAQLRAVQSELKKAKQWVAILEAAAAELTATPVGETATKGANE